MTEFVGVEIGETNIHIGRVNKGVVVKESYTCFDVKAFGQDLLKSLFKSINHHISSITQGIGIGVFTIVNPLIELVFDVQSIPVWKKHY